MSFKEYEVIKQIGEGGYSKVYLIQNIFTRKHAVMKLMPAVDEILNPNSSIAECFDTEVQILEELNSKYCNSGIPKMYDSGLLRNNEHFIIMNHCGTNIEKLKKDSYTVKGHNLVVSACQGVVKALEKLHSIGYVHGDIKPYNILYEQVCDEEPSFTLIDFGISTRYIDEEGNHIPKTKRSKFKGSLEFTAQDCLNKYCPTRKHDLESLVLTMLYLFNGQSLFSAESCNSDGGNRITQQLLKRQRLAQRAKAHGMSMYEYMVRNLDNPEAILAFINEIDNLGYDETPDYNKLIEMLEACKIDISSSSSETFTRNYQDDINIFSPMSLMSFLKASFSTANSSKQFIDVKEEKKTKPCLEKSKFISDKKVQNESGSDESSIESSNTSEYSFHTCQKGIFSEEFDISAFSEHDSPFAGVNVPSSVVSGRNPFQ